MLRLCCSKCTSSSVQPQTLQFLHKFHLIFPYSTSTSTSTNVPNGTFSKYLVDTLGLTQQQALSTSTRLSQRKKFYDFKFVANANNVLLFLKQHGFDNAHVIKVVSLYPRILCANVDKTLNPKFMLFQQHGFSRPDLICVLSRCPSILDRNMKNMFSPELRTVMGSHENLVQLFKNFRRLFASLVDLKNVVTNAALLNNGYGVDIETIRKHILYQPTSFARDTEFFRSVVIRVEEESGIPRSSRMFLRGIILLCNSSNKSLECKRQVFKSFGWTEYHVSELLRRDPRSFCKSEENIRRKLGFLMNMLGYKPDYLASHSSLFTYSLEERMMPRHRVLQVLKEKGLLDYSFYTATSKTENLFLKRFIEPFKSVVPGLLEFYQNCKGSTDVDSLSR